MRQILLQRRIHYVLYTIDKGYDTRSLKACMMFEILYYEVYDIVALDHMWKSIGHRETKRDRKSPRQRVSIYISQSGGRVQYVFIHFDCSIFRGIVTSNVIILRMCSSSHTSSCTMSSSSSCIWQLS